MRNKLQISFTDSQMEIIREFAQEVRLTVSDFCKQAVFYAINDATRRADELEQLELDKKRLEETKQQENSDGTHISVLAESQGVNELELPSADSAALSDTSSDAAEPA